MNQLPPQYPQTGVFNSSDFSYQNEKVPYSELAKVNDSLSGCVKTEDSNVKIGYKAGDGVVLPDDEWAISIGNEANSTSSSARSISIGIATNKISSGANSICMGYNNSQNGVSAPNAISIGSYANSGTSGVNLGYRCCQSGTIGSGIVAVGTNCAAVGIGNNSIAVGFKASELTALPANSIVFNATGLNYSPTTAGMFVKPIRGVSSVTGLKQLYYDATTGELVYLI